MSVPGQAPDAGKAVRGIIDAAREAVLVVGPDLRISFANATAAAVFARTGSEIDQRRVSEVVRDAALHEAFRDAFSSGSAADLRIEHSVPDKRVFDVHVAPIDLDGEPHAIAIFYDITEVERLERARQEFLSNISHELRTPLTSILAFVETLEDGAVDDRENNRRFLGIIRRSAERMHALISDILELSHIESGNVSVDVRSVGLAPAVADIFAALSSQAAARGVRLVNEVPENAVVSADARRLEQMLTNLIDNAIKFNREGGTATVRLERTGGIDRISVADQGEGITPDQLGRIFERFYRADRARTASVGGTGLGLAIVKHLARLHGGRITAESSLGRGSTFTIELPAAS